MPVLVEESLDFLAPGRGGVFVDCTVGLGGHAEALLERFANATLVGIDQDPEALEIARARLARFGDDRVRLVEANFAEIGAVLDSLALGSVAGLLADLGVSSLQLGRAHRGFSFRSDGPLDMRMGPAAAMTAAEVINSYSEAELERIFRRYGEERQARRIARAVVEARSREAISRTGELRELIHRVKRSPGGRREGPKGAPGRGRIDAATRVFQALRIEVNQELAGLRSFLDQALGMLEGDGRLVVISYHSLEDRIVKTTLRDKSLGRLDQVTGRRQAETRLIEVLTKKPVRPSEAEVLHNPRSRSARLRAARKLRQEER